MSRLLRNEILYVICLLPFLQSSIMRREEFVLIRNIFFACKIISMAICVTLIFMERKKFSKLLWSTTLIILSALISIVFNGSNPIEVSQWFNFAGGILTCTTMGEYFLPILREKLFLITRNLLLIMVLVTAGTVIAYPGESIVPELTGWTALSIGYDNRFVFYTTPLVFMAGMYSITADHKINFMLWVSVIASLFITIATWAVGGFLGTIALAAGVMLFTTFKFFNSISSWIFFLTPQITSLMVCVFQIQYYFRDFIENTLEKDVTLSGRTLLWDRVIYLFFSSPIVGIGVLNERTTMAVLGGLSHAHNEILNYLFRVGLIGMAAHCIFWFLLTAKMNRIKNGRIRGICNMTFFVQLFMGVADSLGGFGLFYLCYICMYCYSDVFERNEQPLLLSA